MSHRRVEQLIGRLLTDEEFRDEFVLAPKDALTALVDQGWDFSEFELDALLSVDVTVWLETAAKIDPRLQRCCMKVQKSKTSGLVHRVVSDE